MFSSFESESFGSLFTQSHTSFFGQTHQLSRPHSLRRSRVPPVFLHPNPKLQQPTNQLTTSQPKFSNPHNHVLHQERHRSKNVFFKNNILVICEVMSIFLFIVLLAGNYQVSAATVAPAAFLFGCSDQKKCSQFTSKAQCKKGGAKGKVRRCFDSVLCVLKSTHIQTLFCFLNLHQIIVVFWVCSRSARTA